MIKELRLPFIAGVWPVELRVRPKTICTHIDGQLTTLGLIENIHLRVEK